MVKVVPPSSGNLQKHHSLTKREQTLLKVGLGVALSLVPIGMMVLEAGAGGAGAELVSNALKTSLKKAIVREVEEERGIEIMKLHERRTAFRRLEHDKLMPWIRQNERLWTESVNREHLLKRYEELGDRDRNRWYVMRNPEYRLRIEKGFSERAEESLRTKSLVRVISRLKRAMARENALLEEYPQIQSEYDFFNTPLWKVTRPRDFVQTDLILDDYGNVKEVSYPVRSRYEILKKRIYAKDGDFFSSTLLHPENLDTLLSLSI